MWTGFVHLNRSEVIESRKMYSSVKIPSAV